MNIAVLGTGVVGNAIASKLVSLGHEVKMGSRTPDNEKAAAWVKRAGALASQGTFAGAASFGEVVFVCTNGAATLDALHAAGAQPLAGKVLIDVSNPLDFSKGMPPRLFTASDESLGERVQRAFPDAKVVKALNTVNCEVMVDPGRVGGGDHDMFVAGDDAAAKGRVVEILTGWFGWKTVHDLGDITGARGMEMYLPLWLRLWGSLKTADFNVRVVRG
ncbi:MAG: NAD(P)-binding domain-containing protein [Deltaproteobacteria bacterium]|nr:NAD(P)-binding domain-containing protein [Deltaproteobacteria bacterium]